MTIDLTDTVAALIGLLSAIITGVLVPYIKVKLNNEQQQNLAYWTQIAVSAAEGIFTNTGAGKEKYEYVVNFLKNKNITFNDDEIKTLIESTVYDFINSVTPSEVKA